MSCCQHVQPKPGLPNADCNDCLVVQDWPPAVMMLSWHDAADPAPWGICNVCLSTVFLTMAICPPLKNCRILDVYLRPRSKIWTYWALFADVNKAVWALSKTLLIFGTVYHCPSEQTTPEDITVLLRCCQWLYKTAPSMPSIWILCDIRCATLLTITQHACAYNTRKYKYKHTHKEIKAQWVNPVTWS